MFGHVKKKYPKYHAWCVKKGTFLTLVCFEVNLASIPRNTWWLDSDVTTNISVLMQGFLNYHKPNDVKRYVYVGYGKLIKVEAIRHFRLLLCIEFYLDLKDTFVVQLITPKTIIYFDSICTCFSSFCCIS